MKNVDLIQAEKVTQACGTLELNQLGTVVQEANPHWPVLDLRFPRSQHPASPSESQVQKLPSRKPQQQKPSMTMAERFACPVATKRRVSTGELIGC